MHSIRKASHSRPNGFNRKTIDSKKLKMHETVQKGEEEVKKNHWQLHVA